MNNKKWIAGMVIFGMLFASPLSATAETETDEINVNDIEIMINGMPLEDVIGAASEKFADAVEENTATAVEGLNAVFDEFAQGFSKGLGEIEGMVDGMINDTWNLRFPVLGLETGIRRSPHDNALDLYRAQLSGETDKSIRIAKNTQEDGCNSIVYVYDEGQLTQAVLEGIENGEPGMELFEFGYGNYRYLHRIHAALYLSPSDDPSAICNMSDLRDKKDLEAYTDYVLEHAFKIQDPEFKDGGPLLTIIIWGPDEKADWLTIVAQEEPMLLE